MNFWGNTIQPIIQVEIPSSASRDEEPQHVKTSHTAGLWHAIPNTPDCLNTENSFNSLICVCKSILFILKILFLLHSNIVLSDENTETKNT